MDLPVTFIEMVKGIGVITVMDLDAADAIAMAVCRTAWSAMTRALLEVPDPSSLGGLAAAISSSLHSSHLLDVPSTPYWGDANGPLRLVRAGFNLKSKDVARLPKGTRVLVLDIRQTADGTCRAAISLEGMNERLYGWMTQATKDGTKNITYIGEYDGASLTIASAADTERSNMDCVADMPTGGALLCPTICEEAIERRQ